MMNKTAAPLHIDGLTASAVFDRIAQTEKAGCDRLELRLLAGRLAESVDYYDGDDLIAIRNFKPGMRLWGVLVV